MSDASCKRKVVSVTKKGSSIANGKCKDADEISYTVLLKEKDFTRMAKKLMRPSRQNNSLLLLQLLWFGITYLVGIYESKDGIAALGYLFYHLVFFFYNLLTSIIPFGGIYFLVTSGGIQSQLASTFIVNLSNGWIAYGVNGLYVVLGWIAQIVIDAIIVIIILAMVSSARSSRY